MYQPALITPPAIKPVSTAEAKALPAVATSDDALVSAYIDAAVARLDGWSGILGRCLCQQTWRQDYDSLYYELRLPLFPVISITSVKYDDPNAVEQTIDPANYQLLNDGEGAFVRLNWTFVLPNTNFLILPAVRITYLAGYADDAEVSTAPDAIKFAIKLMVANMCSVGAQSPFLSLRRSEGVAERRWTVSADSLTPMEKTIDALIAPYVRPRI